MNYAYRFLVSQFFKQIFIDYLLCQALGIQQVKKNGDFFAPTEFLLVRGDRQQIKLMSKILTILGGKMLEVL